MRVVKYKALDKMHDLPFLDFYPKMDICVLQGLICLEGPNFVGKTTTIPLLKNRLENRGYKVATLKQPYDTENVVKALNSIDYVRGVKKSSHIYDLKQEVFRQDRYQVEQLIYSMKEEYDFILLDRGELSTAVCQGSRYSFLTLQPQLTYTIVAENHNTLLERAKTRDNRGTLDPKDLELKYRNSTYSLYSSLLRDVFRNTKNQTFFTLPAENGIETNLFHMEEGIMSYTSFCNEENNVGNLLIS